MENEKWKVGSGVRNKNAQNRIEKYICLHSKPVLSAALCGAARKKRDNKPSLYACQESRQQHRLECADRHRRHAGAC